MATEILKKQTIVGTDAQYEANRNSYGEGTVFESTSLLGENDIDPAYTNKFVPTRKVTSGLYLYAFDSTGNISQSADTGKNAYTVARRSAGGTLSVGDPTSQYHAANKGYVDSRFRYTHFIEVEFAPMPDYIVCKGTIIYVSNSSTPLTNINELPLNVTLYMHGLYNGYPGVVYNAKRIGESSVEIGLMQDSDTGISSGETATMTFTIITDTVL